MIKEKEYLNLEDMIKLDEEINFIPITYDRILKSIFTTNKRLLKKIYSHNLILI